MLSLLLLFPRFLLSVASVRRFSEGSARHDGGVQAFRRAHHDCEDVIRWDEERDTSLGFFGSVALLRRGRTAWATHRPRFAGSESKDVSHHR
jgi:hypothetical protein